MVANGPSHPSKAVATFDCEGASVSGLSLELQGSGYKVYLFKERCQAGKGTSKAVMFRSVAYTDLGHCRDVAHLSKWCSSIALW